MALALQKSQKYQSSKLHLENTAADLEDTETWLATFFLPSVAHRYFQENSFTADESGLFYKPTPSGCLDAKVEERAGTNMRKAEKRF